MSMSVCGELDHDLSDEEIETLVMAKMNKPFLDLMQTHYHSDLTQKYKQMCGANEVISIDE